MAALDFPASPTNGQLFYAPTGVVYQYDSGSTSWRTISVAPQGGGDFWATVDAAAWPGTAATVSSFVVQTGNAGGWYNASNGRFTPPAGRYFIYCGGRTGLTTGGVIGIITIRKNGTNIISGFGHSPSGNMYVMPEAQTTLDANGTDWFDCQISGNLATNMSGTIWFGAIPVGVVQSMAAPGTWQLLSKQTLAANAPSIDFTGIPPNITDLQFSFDVTPVTNGVDFCMRFFNSAGVLDTAGNYAFANTTGIHTQNNTSPGVMGSAGSGLTTMIAFDYPLVNRVVGNLTGIRGGGYVRNIRAARLTAADYQSNYVSNDGTVFMAVTGSGYRTLNGPITGLSFIPQPAGNLAAGSTISLYGMTDTTGAIVGNTGRSAFNIRTTTNASYTGPGSTNIFRAAATPVVDYDPEGVWSLANAEFTCPATGRYQFSLTHHGDPTSGGQYSGSVISHLTSAAAVIRNYATPRVINTSGANSPMTTTQTLNMNAGEKVRFMLANPNAIAWTQHAEDATVITGGATLTFASGFRIS
jgi:hypothetical protein